MVRPLTTSRRNDVVLLIGAVVPMVERWCEVPRDGGSNPLCPTITISLTLNSVRFMLYAVVIHDEDEDGPIVIIIGD